MGMESGEHLTQSNMAIGLTLKYQSYIILVLSLLLWYGSIPLARDRGDLGLGLFLSVPVFPPLTCSSFLAWVRKWGLKESKWLAPNYAAGKCSNWTLSAQLQSLDCNYYHQVALCPLKIIYVPFQIEIIGIARLHWLFKIWFVSVLFCLLVSSKCINIFFYYMGWYLEQT